MMYSLDEAATLLSEKLNKTVTARQIRELAIHGETNLRLLYRGKAINCVTELEEEVYGYPYVLCGYITEIEMHGSYPVNQFIFNETIYKIEEGVGIALNLTSDKLLIDEEQINLLIIRADTMPVDANVEASATKDVSAVKTTIHKIKNRSQILDAEISLAKSKALNIEDVSSVWNELVKLANIKTGCLLGLDEKSIKYQDGDEVKFFSKRNLSERMSRAITR